MTIIAVFAALWLLAIGTGFLVGMARLLIAFFVIPVVWLIAGVGATVVALVRLAGASVAPSSGRG